MRHRRPARVTDELGRCAVRRGEPRASQQIDRRPRCASTNDKFERRFRYVETRLAAQGRKPAEATLEEMEALWQEAKTKT